MRARLLSLAVVLACLAALWAGCSIYGQDLLVAAGDASVDGFVAPDAPAGDSSDASVIDATGSKDAGDGGNATDAAVDSGNEDSGCMLVHPPPPPSEDDPSDAGNLSIVFAVQTYDLGIRPDGGPSPLYGYDIDGLCTCPGPGDCVPIDDGAVSCDEPGGIDNVGGIALRNFYELSGGNFFSQDLLNSEIANGYNTLLFTVQQYNGTPNDTQVDVAVYVSDGTPAVSDGGPHAVPQWNGQDEWTVDSRTVFGGAGPPIVPLLFDLQAYVTGGVLVASLPEEFVPLQIDESDLIIVELDSAYLTGNLVQTGSQWSVQNGIVDGRLLASNLLGELAYVHDPANPSSYLCPSSTTYSDLVGFICPNLDITDNPSAPHTAACDGVSMALSFVAQAAQFGAVQTQARPTTCPDGGPNHC
jgi:hypothetical protein